MASITPADRYARNLERHQQYFQEINTRVREVEETVHSYEGRKPISPVRIELQKKLEFICISLSQNAPRMIEITKSPENGDAIRALHQRVDQLQQYLGTLAQSSYQPSGSEQFSKIQRL